MPCGVQASGVFCVGTLHVPLALSMQNASQLSCIEGGAIVVREQTHKTVGAHHRIVFSLFAPE